MVFIKKGHRKWNLKVKTSNINRTFRGTSKKDCLKQLEMWTLNEVNNYRNVVNSIQNEVKDMQLIIDAKTDLIKFLSKR